MFLENSAIKQENESLKAQVEYEMSFDDYKKQYNDENDDFLLLKQKGIKTFILLC